MVSASSGQSAQPKETQLAIRKASSNIDREGVVTESRIEAGSHVHTMAGEVISLPTLYWRLLTRKIRTMDDVLVLGYVHFLVPEPLSLAINHSCDPNCGFRTTRDLYAIRAIEAGEELTFDYSLTVKGIVWWTMSCRCNCGASNCRGVIGSIATLPEDVYERYLRLGVIPKQFQISRRFAIGHRRFGI